MSDYRIICGDALASLKTLPDESVQCCVTSPPYWGLRDYKLVPVVWGGDPSCRHKWEKEGVRRSGRDWDPTLGRSPVTRETHASTGMLCACGAWRGSLGLEPTPELYVAHLVDVFREVRRVLRKDGTLWLNLGDSFNSIGHKKSNSGYGSTGLAGGIAQEHSPLHRENSAPGLKQKDLIGIPWRVAFALQADGWYLRLDIIWSKPNVMPQSVSDRPTKAHEYLFLLAKSERYYYDAEAIAERLATDPNSWGRHSGKDPGLSAVEPRPMFGPGRAGRDGTEWGNRATRNRRSVWTIATEAYPEAHSATFPEALVEPCINAGCPAGGTALDPFCGSGTTLSVARRLGCNSIGIELNPQYVKLAEKRLAQEVLDLNAEGSLTSAKTRARLELPHNERGRLLLRV